MGRKYRWAERRDVRAATKECGAPSTNRYRGPIGGTASRQYRPPGSRRSKAVSTEGTAIKRPILGAAIATLLTVLPLAEAAQAASCNGASHTPTLSNGRVSPDTGAAGSVFRFIVRYRDTGNCAPNYVRVRVPGIGTFAMRGSGTDYDGGVQFALDVVVATAGRHDYEFVASSGSGNGTKTTTLTDVRPRTFHVVAPTPTPKPTPKPTPLPATPQPTAAPTSKPAKTAEPTRRPKRSRAPKATRQATPTASATPAVVLPGPTDRPGGFRVPPRPRHDPAGFDLFRIRLDPVLFRVAQWSGITAAGLLLLFALTWRRGERQAAGAADDPGPARDDPAPRVAPTAATAVPPPAPAASVRRDEANMPRWLRPSVQAGRQGRSLED